VIRGDYAKRRCAHQIFSCKRPTPNVQRPIQKIVELLAAASTCFSVSVVDTTTATTNRLASPTERVPPF
jgi:hypothetical protein